MLLVESTAMSRAEAVRSHGVSTSGTAVEPGRRRTHAAVEREYGTEKWPRVRSDLDAVLAELGPGAPLSRIVGLTRAASGDARDPLIEVVADGQRIRLPASAAYGAHRALVVRSVLARCVADTDLVVDLGAGWGHLLASVWSDGGPAGAAYVAAEYTAAGRGCAARMSEVALDVDLRAIPFDHTAPDLSCLGADHRHAVIFSCHSVEQAPRLGARWVEALVGVADRVDVVHLEPVGWQTGDAPVSSAAYADEHDYNRDLVPVLRQAEADGVLAIERVEVDVIGVNPTNPSTLITWTASRR